MTGAALAPEPCEVCGATGDVEAHHDDYAKPLEVRWLCPSHHKLLHISLKRAGTPIVAPEDEKRRANRIVRAERMKGDKTMSENVKILSPDLQRRLNLSDREYKAIQASARGNDRTTSAEIRRAIREYLDRQAEQETT